MGFRIVTWNVNGIRNPFNYPPWNDKRSYATMFDTLEADIICIQECKIQKKDLLQDMALVPGWDSFFSLPINKKGYSGVAIYTRQSKCCPIRAEEGITGALKAVGSSKAYRDLPEDQQIGGYPTTEQLLAAGLYLKDFDTDLEGPPINADTGEVTPTVDVVDSEGRTVILEFPAFVIIGVYCPANTTEKRTNFRIAFLQLFEARIRNLVAMGKKVVALGDFNIIRNLRDVAGATEMLRKEQMSAQEFMQMPARWMFNHLLVNGEITGERDENREGIMVDICREFHPQRYGMYTHWDTKKNHRPANFGSRIDYIICNESMRGWFESSDIQEGLIGSDHCPVYAIVKDRVEDQGALLHFADIMNPKGMFAKGERQEPLTQKHLLPNSSRLFPGFGKSHNIKDMFSKRPTPTIPAFDALGFAESESQTSVTNSQSPSKGSFDNQDPGVKSPTGSKRTAPASPLKPMKRSRSNGSVSATPQTDSKQKSLMGFFAPKAASTVKTEPSPVKPVVAEVSVLPEPLPVTKEEVEKDAPEVKESAVDSFEEPFIDPFVSKASWDKLFTRKKPRCNHGEPCIILTSKKAGMNMGRSFWICPRPNGPSGAKEVNTEWRCATFIWDSDWQNGNGSAK